MKRTIIALAIAGGLATMAAPAQAQTTLTMSNWVPPTHPIVVYIMKPWAEQVEKATAGRVKINMLPKARIEIATSDALAPQIVDVIRQAANTGSIGDGKIFVSEIGQAVRIRTGEIGDEAL